MILGDKIILAVKHPVATFRYLMGDESTMYNLVIRSKVCGPIGSLLGRLDGKQKELSRLYAFSQELKNQLKKNRAEPHWRTKGKVQGGDIDGAILYLLCRVVRPRCIVETGVQHGLFSSYILKALNDNQYGELYSIDLPNKEYMSSVGKIETPLPEGLGSGWLVPAYLRSRWELLLGNSKELLPGLLDRLGQIDIFLHDSEHTYEMMMFEYEQAWKHLGTNGVLVSDDIDMSNAFEGFARMHGRKYTVFSSRTTTKLPRQGAIIK